MTDNQYPMWNPPRKLSAYEAFVLTDQARPERGLRAYMRRALEMSQLTREPLLKTALMLPLFAWTAPTTRSTGDLITASIFNTDIVDNLLFLHQRPVTKFFTFGDYSDSAGDFSVNNIANGGNARGTFMVPDDFDALVSIELLASHASTGTWTFTVSTDYFNPDAAEAITNHSGSMPGATQVVAADIPEFINIASAFASLAAGDFAGVAFTNTSNSGGSGACRMFGIRLMYTRT
jgi:hypothetical protein